MKKHCSACGNKIGFFTLSLDYELKNGERVCSKCLESLGLSIKQYTDRAFTEKLKTLDLEDIQQALSGNKDKLEYIRHLSTNKAASNTGASASTGQKPQAQIQTEGKKACTICGVNISFASIAFQVKTGERVCSNCIESLGISTAQHAQQSFKKDFNRLPLATVKQAFEGDSSKKEQILKLATRATERNAQKQATKEAERNIKASSKEAKRNNKEDTKEAQHSITKAEKQDGMVYKFDGGAGDILLVYEDRVTIRRKGLVNVIVMGLKGDKTLYLSDITSIQFKKAGITAGYIQFSIPGGVEGSGGVFDAVQDENTITFKENDKLAEEIVSYLNGQLRKIKSPTPQTTTIVNQVSVADELMKFKGLLDAGILTQQEFDKKKSELLNQ